MALTFCGSAETPLDETIKPKKMTLSVKKEHFFKLAYKFSLLKVEQNCLREFIFINSWKLYIKLQMISFVIYRLLLLLLLLRLFAEIALVCLVVIPNTLGGKPRLFYINLVSEHR